MALCPLAHGCPCRDDGPLYVAGRRLACSRVCHSSGRWRMSSAQNNNGSLLTTYLTKVSRRCLSLFIYSFYSSQRLTLRWTSLCDLTESQGHALPRLLGTSKAPPTTLRPQWPGHLVAIYRRSHALARRLSSLVLRVGIPMSEPEIFRAKFPALSKESLAREGNKGNK